MHIVSKSAFARLCNVQPSAVSNWIASGILSGEAIVGEGRTARINVEVARVQVNQRRDIGQALGNGLKVRLRPEAPPPAAPMPPAAAGARATPDVQTARALWLDGVIYLAGELPSAIATKAFDEGVSRVEAERIEALVHEGIREEIGLIAFAASSEVGMAAAEILAQIPFSQINWDAVEADRDEAP